MISGVKKVVTLALDNAQTRTVKAISKGSSCLLLLNTVTPKLTAFKFDLPAGTTDLTSTGTAVAIGDIATSIVNTGATGFSSINIELADLCNAIKVDDKVYHLSGSAFSATQDTLPATAWVNPVFTGDFSYVADNTGIFKYTSSGATSSYASFMVTPLYANKRIWVENNQIIVLSWASFVGEKDYTLQAFDISAGAT